MSRPRHRWRALAAMRDMRSQRNQSVSDGVVGCGARALSLICPPCPVSVGTTHPTRGLFGRLHWATSPRSGGRCAPLHAGAVSGTLAGRAEVRVLPVADGLWALVPVLRGQAPRTWRRGRSLAYALPGRTMPPAGRRRRCTSIPTRPGTSAPPTQQWLALRRLGVRPTPPPRGACGTL